ncbi:hypothetical protein QYE76_011513 [Lolium multiflorum]|uniref:Reverse transcriptase domain-containing protein n=1 Tax=Lolium multiflorum TaxID=4521 RepID=A0AAD8X329_LOLMU|nr:hypothetical protein QYE76_011513 [Lolium multiflorum]
MASPAGSSNQASGSRSKKTETIGDLLQHLGIDDDELDNLVFEEEESTPKQGLKWMALAKVKDGGPWLFRKNIVCIEEYDGLVDPESIDLNYFDTWIQIHKLPIGYRNVPLIKNLTEKKVGKVIKVETNVQGLGNFVRVRVRLDVRKNIARVVTISRNREAVGEANVLAKLAHMHASLHAWDKDILQKPKCRLRSAQRKLDRALAGPMSEENEIIAKEQAALIELLLEQDEDVDPELLEKIQPKVSDNMNESLVAPFTAEDVKKAAFSIGDLKAPGPDGLHAIFYKRFWNICGPEITSEVLQALNTWMIPNGWNDTNVVLIPKVDNPESITQFRPISLCNVIYKIISKMLSFRLKRILPEIISPMQGAFVPERLITDNVLLAYESIHSIKNRRNGTNGACAVKLDMHKAYDRVEWIFLENMMRRLGFAERNPSKEIFSELDEINAQGPIFARSFQKTEREAKWGHEVATHRAARPKPWPRRPVVWALVPPFDLPFRLLKASVAKPPYREPRYGKHYRDAAAASHLGGFGDRLRHPAGEGIITGGALHHHARLRIDA